MYDWVLERQKQWLESGNKERVPDLAEARTKMEDA
jgi:hypothetical protein